MVRKILKRARFVLTPRDPVPAVLVKMNAEPFRQSVEVLEFRVPFVVAEQNQRPPLLYPLDDRLRRFRADQMRIGTLQGRVGIDDDVDRGGSERPA